MTQSLTPSLPTSYNRTGPLFIACMSPSSPTSKGDGPLPVLGGNPGCAEPDPGRDRRTPLTPIFSRRREFGYHSGETGPMEVRKLVRKTFPLLSTAALLHTSVAGPGCSFGDGSAPS